MAAAATRWRKTAEAAEEKLKGMRKAHEVLQATQEEQAQGAHTQSEALAKSRDACVLAETKQKDLEEERQRLLGALEHAEQRRKEDADWALHVQKRIEEQRASIEQDLRAEHARSQDEVPREESRRSHCPFRSV